MIYLAGLFVQSQHPNAGFLFLSEQTCFCSGIQMSKYLYLLTPHYLETITVNIQTEML